MVQFNLLPDVKQEYVNARRTKQLVVLISFVVSAVALGIMLLLLLTVDVVQKKSLHDANNDIQRYSTQLKAVPDLNKILTVQNQLNTLPGLHDKKPVVSRIFGFLSQLTPNTASINTLNTDFTANTMTLSGQATTIDQVNVYVDTLKATTYTTDASNKPQKAFSSVVLSGFGVDSSHATYSLSLTFDPTIFSNLNSVSLSVPTTTTGPQQQLFQEESGS